TGHEQVVGEQLERRRHPCVLADVDTTPRLGEHVVGRRQPVVELAGASDQVPGLTGDDGHRSAEDRRCKQASVYCLGEIRRGLWRHGARVDENAVAEAGSDSLLPGDHDPYCSVSASEVMVASLSSAAAAGVAPSRAPLATRSSALWGVRFQTVTS